MKAEKGLKTRHISKLNGKRQKNSDLLKRIKRDKYLLLLLVPVVAYFLVFHYAPMFGTMIAFQDFSPGKGFMNSPWVGFKWFEEFFKGAFFWRLLKNTILISFYGLLWGFPIPIFFALMLNEVKAGPFKKITQTVSYLPHFVSVVVVVGLLVNFLSPTDGVVNTMIAAFGGDPINFMKDPSWFRTLYVGSDVWQHFGWNSIIYLAALSNVDPQLYEAAKIDGAGKFRQLISVTLPAITGTIIILLIMQIGNIMSVGYEKIILMYSPAIYDVSDVINTYVYRRGIVGSQFSFGAAVGLFNSLINFLLIITFNKISKKTSDISLW